MSQRPLIRAKADIYRRQSAGLRRRRPPVRCPRCGRFARFDVLRDQWWCELDERKVDHPVSPNV